MGPGWYWCENFQALIESGKASQMDVIAHIKAGEHAPADSLKGPLEALERFVVETLVYRCRRDFAPYTEEIALSYAKAMILGMQGLWTQQHHYSWKCVTSTMPEDAAGPVHMTQIGDEGAVTMMSRTERLSCVNMYPIGIIALNKEHLHLYKLRRALSSGFRICGVNVDCMYLKAKSRQDKKQQETELIELIELDKCQPIKRALGFTSAGMMHPDGSPIFRVERDGAELKQHHTKPLPWTPRCHVLPIESPWAPPTHKDDDDGDETPLCENFGWWLQKPPMRREWKIYERPGIGCGSDDSYQAEVVDMIVKNRGAFVVGRGGTGKSKLITGMKSGCQAFRGLVEAFKELDLLTYVVALTHTAVANVTNAEIEASTLLRSLHGNVRRKKLMAIIVDECSQIPLSMQSVLMELKMMGHVLIQMGDPHGQFLPIPDQNRQHLVERIDTSDLMHDMCNGLHITLKKFRRGDDMKHFDFVGSLYWQNVHDALIQSLYEYELVASGDANPLIDGVTLTVSHKRRVAVNDVCNRVVRPFIEGATRFVDVDIVAAVVGVNHPQSMWLHCGLILQACTPRTDAHLRNGMRYEILDFTNEDGNVKYKFESSDEFGHRRLDNYTVPVEPRRIPEKVFWLSEEDVMRKMRMTFAVTYFSAQAATIRQPLRLEDTRHRFFTTRHLIVGLGRAPLGCRVQLCGRGA
jgi:hypothetical protein